MQTDSTTATRKICVIKMHARMITFCRENVKLGK